MGYGKREVLGEGLGMERKVKIMIIIYRHGA